MAISETEAAERWCPFARVRWANKRDDGSWTTTSGDPSFNRTMLKFPGREHLVARCVGRDCMAWRSEGVAVVETVREMDGLSGYRDVALHEEVGSCGMVAPVPSPPSSTALSEGN